MNSIGMFLCRFMNAYKVSIKRYDEVSICAMLNLATVFECHGRDDRALGAVDVVMWQDVPRSSLFFGMGCFFILSASLMQEMSCG